MPASHRVSTFFYGSYMNPDVLADVDIHPAEFRTARLPGFDIAIGPLANLIRSDEHTVYGVLAALSHAELDRLYEHAEDVLGGVYLPEAVIVYPDPGSLEPALTYIASELPTAAASPDYVERILIPAREFGFPRWFIDRLESFKI